MTEKNERLPEFLEQFPVFQNAGIKERTLEINAAEVEAELSEEYYGDLYPTLCRWLLAHKTALTNPVDSSTLTVDGSVDDPLEQTVFGREFLRIKKTKPTLPGVF